MQQKNRTKLYVLLSWSTKKEGWGNLFIYYELSNAIKKKGQVRTHFWVVVVQRPIIIKMAAGLSDAQIEEFREAFHLFDKNQDGTITTKDLGNVLKAIGQNPSDEETQQLMERVNNLNKVKGSIY